MPPAPVTLILGGARSGKSAHAERLAATAARPVYLATAEIRDQEMAERIALHRARRGEAWQTVEEPRELVTALARHRRPEGVVLVDCLTLWLSNLMEAERDIAAETAALVAALAAPAGPVILVSNEVGLGLVPETPLGRRFRDHAGRLHQAVAAVADHVVLLVAGLPLVIKDASG